MQFSVRLPCGKRLPVILRPLYLWLRRRKIARHNLIGKAGGLVRAVAKGLVCRMAAPAERNNSASCQPKGFPLRIEDLDVALKAQRAIVVHGDFGARHSLLRLKTCA